MDEPVTILIPVGPNYNPEWLKEAVASVRKQVVDVQELLVIGDGHFVDVKALFPDQMCNDYYTRHLGFGKKYYPFYGGPLYGVSFWHIPVNLGFTAAFNLGMELASNELVMYLAADDKLMPTAVEKAVQAYLDNDKKDAWYHLKYIDSNGNISQIPNNVMLTTKHFFLDMCGGFPPAAFVGPDAALMSCLMVHAPDRIIPVQSEEPLYWIRDHDQQETKLHTWKYVPEMNSIRDKLTKEFRLRE